MPDKSFVPPELGPLNVAPRRAEPMHADHHWHSRPWYEVPRGDPALPEVHTYTDAMSYDPGDEVVFHSSSTATAWSLDIYRDGTAPRTVHRVDAIGGRFSPMPTDAYRSGCGWPVSHRWRLPDDLASGFYRVVSTCDRQAGGKFVQHHFFVVRPTAASRRARILMVLPTATWTAYNDFGGANHYFGIAGPDKNLAVARAQPRAAMDPRRRLAAGRRAAHLRRSTARNGRRATLCDEGMGFLQRIRPVLRGCGLGPVRPTLRGMGREGGLFARYDHTDRPALSARTAGRLSMCHRSSDTTNTGRARCAWPSRPISSAADGWHGSAPTSCGRSASKTMVGRNIATSSRRSTTIPSVGPSKPIC